MTSTTGFGSSTCTMWKIEHSYYVMQDVPKVDDWMGFTQMKNDKINTLANKPEDIVTKMNAHEE